MVYHAYIFFQLRAGTLVRTSVIQMSMPNPREHNCCCYCSCVIATLPFNNLTKYCSAHSKAAASARNAESTSVKSCILRASSVNEATDLSMPATEYNAKPIAPSVLGRRPPSTQSRKHCSERRASASSALADAVQELFESKATLQQWSATELNSLGAHMTISRQFCIGRQPILCLS